MGERRSRAIVFLAGKGQLATLLRATGDGRRVTGDGGASSTGSSPVHSTE